MTNAPSHQRLRLRLTVSHQFEQQLFRNRQGFSVAELRAPTTLGGRNNQHLPSPPVVAVVLLTDDIDGYPIALLLLNQAHLLRGLLSLLPHTIAVQAANLSIALRLFLAVLVCFALPENRYVFVPIPRGIPGDYDEIIVLLVNLLFNGNRLGITTLVRRVRRHYGGNAYCPGAKAATLEHRTTAHIT